jgi:hypothetical protein
MIPKVTSILAADILSTESLCIEWDVMVLDMDLLANIQIY